MAHGQTGILLRHIRRLAGGQTTLPLSDPQLLERFVKQRDEAAFAELVERHSPMVWRVCCRVLHDHHAAEDALQATFLVLVRKAGSIRRRELLANWLYGVAYRLAARARVDAATRRSREDMSAARPPADAQAEVAGGELCAVLEEELNGLPDRYRGPFLLCFVEGQTRDQAARQLGWSLRTLQRRLERGRELLRGRLTRRGVTLTAALLAPVLAPQTAGAMPRVLTIGAGKTGAVSARAAALAEGALQAMLQGKLKIAAAALVLVSAIAAGTVLLAHQLLPAQPQVAGQEERPRQAKEPPLPIDRLGDPLPPHVLARLGTVRLRQQGPVNTVAFTPDGKLIASAGWTRTVHLWDAATGQEVRSLAIPQQDASGPPTSASCMALSPDGKLLAAGTFHGAVHAWDAATGKYVRELKGKGQAIQTLAFSPDSKTLAAGSGEFEKSGEVVLWEAATGKELRSLEGHRDVIKALAFAPDGQLLASASRDRTIRLWQPARGELVRDIRYPDRAGGLFQEILTLAFSSDGKTLASGGRDQIIHLWNVADGKSLRQLAGHQREIDSLAFTPNGRFLVSGGADGTARLWDVESGRQVRNLRGRETDLTHQEVRSVAVAPDGRTVACGLQSGAIALHRVATGEDVYPDHGHADMVQAVAVSPDGATVATGASDGLLKLWDRATGKEHRCLDAEDTNGIRSMDWSPDGKLLAAATGLMKVLVWEAATGRRLHQLKGRCVAFAPDGKNLAIGGVYVAGPGEEIIELRDLATDRRTGEWGGRSALVGCIAFSPDGTLVASGGSKPRWKGQLVRGQPQPPPQTDLIHIWDVAAGKERLQFGGLADDIHALVFSPDGKTLASVPGHTRGWKETPPAARLWEVATGKERARFAGHAGYINAAAFSSDGTLLATASEDTTIGQWDLATGKARGHYFGHNGPVCAVAFTPDGRGLVSGSMDTTALVWDLARPPRPQPAPAALSPRDLERLWTALAGDDAAAAYRAIWEWRSRPEQAVPFLRQQLRPAASVDERRLASFVADLDTDSFATRERAERELQQLGEVALPALRAALDGKPSLEARRRLERLLERIRPAPLTPATLQGLRALEVLEQVATPEARQVLESLAKGGPADRLTREAKASLGRLAKVCDFAPKRP